jgi:phosphoribosylglycinamide formyltransferase-1
MKRVAIFASGAGSNALNLIQAGSSLSEVKVTCLVVDTETSPLPEILKTKHPEIKIYKILPDSSLKGKERKLEHEKRIVLALQEEKVEWILLAGYMRILGSTLLTAFHQRIVNIHPSLLPLYPGVDSYRRAFEDGVSESGVTIHIVDEGVDTGPVILQEKFPRLPGDTLADFIQRGKEIEWRLYPLVLEKINQSASLLPGV